MNSIPQLAELNVRLLPRASGDLTSELRAELRIGSHQIDIEPHCYSVRLLRAYVSVDLHGLAIMPGTRYGEPTKANTVKTTKKSGTSRTTKRAIKGEISAAILGTLAGRGRISGEVDASRHTSESAETSQEETFYRVKARAENNWEVAESPTSPPLDGTYLNDDPLCLVERKLGSNHCSVTTSIVVKQRDMGVVYVNSDGAFSNLTARLTNNRARVLAIVIAKSLNERATESAASDYRGVITLSKVTVDHEI